MASAKLKFPAKRCSRLHGNGNKKLVSYRDEIRHELLNNGYLNPVEAQVVEGLKAFRHHFGPDDVTDQPFIGFDSDYRNTLAQKLHTIRRSIPGFTIQHHINQDPSDGAVLKSGSAPASHDQLSSCEPKCDRLKANQTPIGAKRRRLSTPLSPLEIRPYTFQCGKTHVYPVPLIKYVSQVPSRTGMVPGSRYTVEMEEDSDSSDDDENECIGRIDSERIQSTKAGSQPSLIRLNQCPIGNEHNTQDGFAVIVDLKHVTSPPKPLCYACGSGGLCALIFCSSCCEPYHPFCTGNETLVSLYLSTNPQNHQMQDRDQKLVHFKKMARIWTCVRCYICYVCKIQTQNSSENFLKCPHCPRVIHVNCCPGGRRSIAANQTTRVCDHCYKCSCGKRIERRTVPSKMAPLCSDCIKQKKKGSYCPLCSVCYDDDDWDTRMMECVKCDHWIHADCEGITLEEYQLLGSLPESVEYICSICEDPSTVYWRSALVTQLDSGWKQVLHLFQASLVQIHLAKQCITATKLDPFVSKPTFTSLVDEKKVPTLVPNRDRALTAETETIRLRLRECSVLLSDCSKSLLPYDQSVTTPNVELKDCSPAKTMLDPVSTLMESMVALNSSRTLKSIYKTSLNFIASLYPHPFRSEVQSRFENAFITVFLWFNPNDPEEDELSSWNESSNRTGTVQDYTTDNTVQEWPNYDVGIETLKDWNPFEDFYWERSSLRNDFRSCSFCHAEGDLQEEGCGRLLWTGLAEWVHVNCALWSSEVWEDENGALQQVGAALSRSKGLCCGTCGKSGASISCCVHKCPKSFHFPCALRSRCVMLQDKGVFCSQHISKAKAPRQEDMRVLRRVHIEQDWNRKRDKALLSSDIGVYIGALKIESLGYLVPLSVQKELEHSSTSRLVPLDFEMSRVFWSIEDSSTGTLSKAKYKMRTRIWKESSRRRNFCQVPHDISVRVDHSKSRCRVARKLKKMSKFHHWVDSTPRYFDEYRHEWLHPSGLLITDSESSGSEADIEDSGESLEGSISWSSASLEESFRFQEFSKNPNNQNQSDCKKSRGGCRDWLKPLDDFDVDSSAETEPFESSTSDESITDWADTGAETEEFDAIAENERLTALRTSIIPQVDGGGDSCRSGSSTETESSPVAIRRTTRALGKPKPLRSAATTKLYNELVQQNDSQCHGKRRRHPRYHKLYPHATKNLIEDFQVYDISAEEVTPINLEHIVLNNGKVHCTRCNNTYRTLISYKGHNCFYFSSESHDEEEEESEPEVVAQPDDSETIPGMIPESGGSEVATEESLGNALLLEATASSSVAMQGETVTDVNEDNLHMENFQTESQPSVGHASECPIAVETSIQFGYAHTTGTTVVGFVPNLITTATAKTSYQLPIPLCCSYWGDTFQLGSGTQQMMASFPHPTTPPMFTYQSTQLQQQLQVVTLQEPSTTGGLRTLQLPVTVTPTLQLRSNSYSQRVPNSLPYNEYQLGEYTNGIQAALGFNNEAVFQAQQQTYYLQRRQQQGPYKIIVPNPFQYERFDLTRTSIPLCPQQQAMHASSGITPASALTAHTTETLINQHAQGVTPVRDNFANIGFPQQIPLSTPTPPAYSSSLQVSTLESYFSSPTLQSSPQTARACAGNCVLDEQNSTQGTSALFSVPQSCIPAQLSTSTSHATPLLPHPRLQPAPSLNQTLVSTPVSPRKLQSQSLSTASTLAFKEPTTSPNVAVVRPMEHPLQKRTIFKQMEVPERCLESSPIKLKPDKERLLTVSNADASELTVISENKTKSDKPVGKHQPKTKVVAVAEKSPNGLAVSVPQPTISKLSQPSIKLRLKRQADGDFYTVQQTAESTLPSSIGRPERLLKKLRIQGHTVVGKQAGTYTDVVVEPTVYSRQTPSNNFDDTKNDKIPAETNVSYMTSATTRMPSSFGKSIKPPRLTHHAVIVYEVKINDEVEYQSRDVGAVWGYILERVQVARRTNYMPPLALPGNKSEAVSFSKLGLSHRAVQFLLEQLPGINHAVRQGHVFRFVEGSSNDATPVLENSTGSARSEGYYGRKEFDMFGWLASKHRQPTAAPRRPDFTKNSVKKGGSLPIAMKYRNLIKLGTNHLNVFWSGIHGRGLFTSKDVEPGEIVIEYAGEVIRPVLCDLREKYYESKGIGCYMFRIDDHSVVDATMKGNAARFINHSCDPNCRSKTVEVLGTKHILILALRRIQAGEELTYDYKFEQEGDKLPCSCGTKKCKKFLN